MNFLQILRFLAADAPLLAALETVAWHIIDLSDAENKNDVYWEEFGKSLLKVLACLPATLPMLLAAIPQTRSIGQ